MTKTNIKNLPEGKFFTEVGYSQQYPWVELSRTAKTVTLAKVCVAPDPEWKPEFYAGGFAGHCANQSKQTWLFRGIKPTEMVTIRLTKKGWSRKGVRFIEDRAVEFYDFSF